MNLRTQARELIRNLDQRISPSLYDTAWLVRLDGGGKSAASLLDWLLENQHEDGSWGAAIRYYHHDRMICTLMASVALAEQPRSPRIALALQQAETYLWQHAHMLFRDPALTELVGFELIFPTLMREARRLGLHLPTHNYGITEIKNEKLRIIPPEMLFSRDLTTVHSLEFLGLDIDADALHGAVFENGSLGNSPATTAYYLLACRRQGERPIPAAREYLERVEEKYRPVCYLFPFRNFETLWVLNNFALVDAELVAEELRAGGHLQALQTGIERGGIGLDDEFGIADADCTSVAYSLLGTAGLAPNPGALMRFEVPGQALFRTYDFERNPSISTNIHALEALRRLPDYPNRKALIENIEEMLIKSRRFRLFWTDKWHASPFYATAYALIALLNGSDVCRQACADSVDWLVHAQRADGSWGFFDRGTVEETAYAMLALQLAFRHGAVPADILRRGAAYLLAYQDPENGPQSYVPLWLGKCLYAPNDIIRSAVLSVLIQQEALFGTAG